IVALYGAPGNLEARIEQKVKLTTESETGPTHSAFFNRGSVATQEYARRFQNKKPSEVGAAAYEWLSRGLFEALKTFLERATDQNWEIHGAVYEFQWPDALAAIKQARGRQVKVKVLFDDVVAYTTKKGKKTPKGPWFPNRKAIAAAKIKSVCV